MSQYYDQYASSASPAAAENLQFYHGAYRATPSQMNQPGSSMGGYPGQSGLRTGWLAAFSAEGYEHEPPLLEELDVHFGHIQSNALVVLNPFAHTDQLGKITDSPDLAGPLFFVVLFGTFVLLGGQTHFGYIYGLALVGSIALHTILGLMTPDTPAYSGPEATRSFTFTKSASVLGYCLLPLVLTSLVGIAMSLDGLVGYILTGLATLWSTARSSAIFCLVGDMRNMRGLVAYPVALFYVGFGIITIFSSRRNGAASGAGIS